MKRYVKFGQRRKKPMNKIPRVVLDTNVLISATFRSLSSIPNTIYQALKKQQFILITSPAILEELEEVLAREKILKRTGMSQEERIKFIEELIEIAFVIPGKKDIKVIQADPDDDKFVIAAAEGFADYIVSGDHHLLDLKKYEDISILSPSDFLNILKMDENNE